MMMTPETKEATVHHAKRWGGWWVGAVVLIAVIGVVANQQLEVVAYKIALLCIAMFLSYVFDRTLFSNAPDVDRGMPRDVLSAARLVARAVVAGFVITGVMLGI
jgi:hypothetical protein